MEVCVCVCVRGKVDQRCGGEGISGAHKMVTEKNSGEYKAIDAHTHK